MPSSDALLSVILSVIPIYKQVIKLKLCPLRDVNCIPCQGLQRCALVLMYGASIDLGLPNDMVIPYALWYPPPSSPCFQLLRQNADNIFAFILPWKMRLSVRKFDSLLLTYLVKLGVSANLGRSVSM